MAYLEADYMLDQIIRAGILTRTASGNRTEQRAAPVQVEPPVVLTVNPAAQRWIDSLEHFTETCSD